MAGIDWKFVLSIAGTLALSAGVFWALLFAILPLPVQLSCSVRAKSLA
jgi:hypothetical protein